MQECTSSLEKGADNPSNEGHYSSVQWTKKQRCSMRPVTKLPVTMQLVTAQLVTPHERTLSSSLNLASIMI